MNEVLTELREIKELLRIIASNTEQKINKVSLKQSLEKEANHLNQEIQKLFHKET